MAESKFRDNEYKRTKTKRKGKIKPKRNSSMDHDSNGRDYDVKSPTNDPSWYSQNPQLLKDAASLNFSNALGVPIGFRMNVEDVDLSGPNNLIIPGIQVIDVVPCPGHSYSLVSPINNASTAMFTFVRKANSGYSNYNSPDLMIYAIAMGQIYSYLNWLQRIYGTVNLYANFNRYIPQAIIEAQRVDFNDLQSNLANFRYGINTLIYKASSLACPAAMPYFRRLAFLFSGIYSEGESIKSQMYMYNPVGFMKYSENTSETGGSLELLDFMNYAKSSLLTVDELIRYGNEMLDPILQSEDMNIMSGDILKAYEGNILRLATLPEVYNIMPTTDLSVLEQMANATVGPSYDSSSIKYNFRIHQNLSDNSIDVDAYYTGNYPRLSLITSDRMLLNTVLTNPTPEDVIERTRMMNVHKFMLADPATDSITEIYGGTEVATGFRIIQLTESGNATSVGYSNVYTLTAPVNSAALQSTFRDFFRISNFKFHPIIWTYETSSKLITSPFVDLDNYTTVHADVVEKMNEMAMLSLFNVPSVARV